MSPPRLPLPAPGLAACVVVPARDEEDRIGACLTALLGQAAVTAPWEVLVVLDGCTDGTAGAVAEAAGDARVPILAVDGPADGAGAARRAGMDVACERLHAAGRPDGLIASTDADTVVARDWLAVQLVLVAAGAQAIGGDIDLHRGEAAELDPEVRSARTRSARARLHAVRTDDPAAEHHHFGGASCAVTAAVYRRVGGMEPLTALEDEAFARHLGDHGIPILRSRAVRVRTSARSHGRAERGLAVDLGLATWRARRRFTAAAYDPDALREVKDGRTVAVVLPAREVAGTVGGVIRETVGPMLKAGLVDEVLVVDAASADGTASAAEAEGATVVQQDALLAQFGPALGKGDAMWRSLAATNADLICFLDADTEDPHPHHLLGLLGPLLAEPGVQFVKGAFDRPFRLGDTLTEDEGGRVTELMARPLLNLHAPPLAGFRQPLAGELGARRDLLCRLPFPVGYGVEIAMLLDVWRAVGVEAMAESWLGSRQNRHQPLRSLGEMAYAVLVATQRRIDERLPVTGRYARPWSEGEQREVPVLERPPLGELADAAAHRV